MHDDAGQRRTFIRHLDVLDAAARVEPRGSLEGFHTARIGSLALFALGLHEALADMIVMRRAKEVRRGRELVPLRRLRIADSLEPLRFSSPLGEPRLIIADEATSALDVTVRSQILDLLLDLQERLALSYILISHDLGVIRYFCDRVAVMYRGNIVETGSTEKICTDPDHPYTKALLSAAPGSHPGDKRIMGRHRYVPVAEVMQAVA